jgi:hypothetical protein
VEAVQWEADAEFPCDNVESAALDREDVEGMGKDVLEGVIVLIPFVYSRKSSKKLALPSCTVITSS